MQTDLVGVSLKSVTFVDMIFVMVSRKGRVEAVSCTFHIENGERRHCFCSVTEGKPLLTTLTRDALHFKGRYFGPGQNKIFCVRNFPCGSINFLVNFLFR